MAELKADGTRRISLTESQFRSCRDILSRFLRKTKCSVIMLCDESGLTIAQVGCFDENKLSVLSTLAAGNHAATTEMARIIGEKSGFRVLFHEGENNNIYVTEASRNFLIIVVFSEATTFGMVRVLTAKVCEELENLLENIPADEEARAVDQAFRQNIESTDFREELGARLDSVLFGTKN